MIETTTELIIGIAFGLVIGIGPAIAVGALGAVRRARDSRLPLPASVALGTGFAALNGHFVGVLEPGVVRTQLPRVATGALVVALLSMYATSQGERVVSELPFGSGWSIRRVRSLSAEAIDSVDAMGQVTIRTTGRIRDIDGYPPLSPDVRAALEADAWRFPADLPLAALETRLETRLRTEYQLAAVSATIDGRGRATVAAAPASGTIATAVPDGWRAVSISALGPAGVAPGDVVDVHVRDRSVTGTVLRVGRGGQSGNGAAGASASETPPSSDPITDSGAGSRERVSLETGSHPPVGAVHTVRRSTGETTGGAGPVTVAVPSAHADPLLSAERARIVVRATGPDADREALFRLERAAYAVRRVPFGSVAAAVDQTDGATDDSIRVLAANRSDPDANVFGPTNLATVAERETWLLDPDVTTLEDRDEVFVVGKRTALRRFGNDRDSNPESTVIPAVEATS